MELFFLDDPPQSGVRNMSVDEALLEHGKPILRFYRWSEPTVSLGYFQRYVDRNTHEASRNAPLVRRRSGGGAIVHDRELTYSLVLPKESRRLELYEAMHRSIITVLKRFGVESELSGVDRGGKDEFLCFHRIAAGDVVVRRNGVEKKIVGSAQYRNGSGGVLQHGSVLLDRSEAAPELEGIRQIFGLLPPTEELVQALKEQLENVFFWRFQSFIPETIENTVAFLQKKRYAEESWTKKK